MVEPATYNSENSRILALHGEGGDKVSALLFNRSANYEVEFAVVRNFSTAHYAGVRGYECLGYSWSYGRYFDDVVSAVDYWKSEVLGRESPGGEEPAKEPVKEPASHSIRESLFEAFGSTATPDDIAQPILHVSPTTCRRLLLEGVLPGVKVGKHWVIPTAKLADFLEGKGAKDE